MTSTAFQLPAISNILGQPLAHYCPPQQSVPSFPQAMVYKCDHPGCDRQFNRKYTLAEHQMTHTGEKPHVCPVKSCAKSFSTSGNLSRHKRLHGYIEPLQCPVQGCVCTFPSNNKLAKHMKFHFGSEDIKVCAVTGCGKTFSTTGNLNRHLKAVHDSCGSNRDSVSSHCSSPTASSASPDRFTRSPTAADQWMPHQEHPQQQRSTGHFEPEASWLGSAAPQYLPSIHTTAEDAWNADVFDALATILDEQEAAAAPGPMSALLNCNMSVFQHNLQFAPMYHQTNHRF